MLSGASDSDQAEGKGVLTHISACAAAEGLIRSRNPTNAAHVILIRVLLFLRSGTRQKELIHELSGEPADRRGLNLEQNPEHKEPVARIKETLTAPCLKDEG